MRFIERKRFVRKMEGFIARGLDLLEAGAPFPGTEDAALEYVAPPGRYQDIDLEVDEERIGRLAAARGVTAYEAMNACLRIGQRRPS